MNEVVLRIFVCNNVRIFCDTVNALHNNLIPLLQDSEGCIKAFKLRILRMSNISGQSKFQNKFLVLK